MAKNDRAGKAALLTELLGVSRVEDLRKSGVLPRPRDMAADPEALAWHRNRLIEKFRERGLFAGDGADSGQSRVGGADASHTVQPATEFAPGSLGKRLAKHLNPERLVDEHPAVIALFLRSQTPQLRSQVLRGLPGGQARAVMRILRASVQGKNPKPVETKPMETKDIAASALVEPRVDHVDEPVVQRPAGTRRAL